MAAISHIGDGRYYIPALKNQVTSNDLGWGRDRLERGINIFLSGLVYILIKDQRNNLPLELNNMDLIRARYENAKDYPNKLSNAQLIQGFYLPGIEYTDTYIVNSQSTRRRIEGNHYTVRWSRVRWTCNCPDFVKQEPTEAICKHVYAVQMLRSQIQGLGPEFGSGRLSQNDILYVAPDSQDLILSQPLSDIF